MSTDLLFKSVVEFYKGLKDCNVKTAKQIDDNRVVLQFDDNKKVMFELRRDIQVALQYELVSSVHCIDHRVVTIERLGEMTNMYSCREQLGSLGWKIEQLQSTLITKDNKVSEYV